MLRTFDPRPGACNNTLTLAETLAYLGVSQEALAELVATGRLRAYHTEAGDVFWMDEVTDVYEGMRDART
jgi:hypothetical protein